MGLPVATTATVYHSGRRRYFSLRSACRDMARIKVFAALDGMGEDPANSENWWRPRVDRLARLYLRWAKISAPMPSPTLSNDRGCAVLFEGIV